jgi:hypothetical protein
MLADQEEQREKRERELFTRGQKEGQRKGLKEGLKKGRKEGREVRRGQVYYTSFRIRHVCFPDIRNIGSLRSSYRATPEIIKTAKPTKNRPQLSAGP